MVFENEQAVIDYVKANVKLHKWVKEARDDSAELKALVDGKDFKEFLITKIDGIESEAKAQSRKKYARSIRDLFGRVLQPTENVFNATGGSKVYNINSDTQKVEFLSTITRIRGNKSVMQYTKDVWMRLYHTDPNGLIFMEYKEDEWTKPTYKSIDTIRNYEDNGQRVEMVVFEPKEIEDETGVYHVWRLVDDAKDYTVIQKGESFRIDEEQTFEHPFGMVPGIVISDLETPGDRVKKSPLYEVVDIAKEYARDQSIKTIYKFLHGFPIHWRYVQTCKTCKGKGKTGDKKCTDCDGKGQYISSDVTDMVTLPVPNNDSPKLAPDIAGFVSPDLETWTRYSSELELLELLINKTLWGSFQKTGENETATGRFIDIQPVINKLNSYADVAQYVEKQITELTANWMLPTKDKKEKVSKIHYGRRYIIESPDAIQKRYQEAKNEGDNVTILDRLLDEYLTAKFGGDPDWLRIMKTKVIIEPYVHWDIKEVADIFGAEEAQKKNLFQKWWAKLDGEEIGDVEELEEEFNEFINQKLNNDEN